jgi:uncharacterized protein YndB with AHSA1/START domain
MEKIEIEVKIAARRRTVYQFLCEPERFRQWIGDADVAPAPGGELAVRYPNGDVARGKFVELVPDQRIVFTWGYDNAANGLPPGSTTVTIELRDIDSGTLLTLRHEGIPSAPARENHLQGWKHYTSRLDNLAVAAQAAMGLKDAIDAYFAAWNEADDERRLALLDRSWDLNGTFCDSMGSVEGRAALSTYIGNALRYAPAAKLEAAGAPQQIRNHVRFDWKIVMDGNAFASGTNFGRINVEGHFDSMVGFWNQ